MTNHFFSSNRGKDGTKQTSVTRATSSTAGDDLELRVADGASLTRKDVIIFLKLLENVFDSGKAVALGGTDFPPL